MLAALVIVAVLLALALIAAASLFVSRRSLQDSLRSRTAERDQLQVDLDATRSQRDSLQQRNHEIERDVAVASEKQRSLERQYEDIKEQLKQQAAEYRETIDQRIKAVTGDALKQSSEQFLTLARKSLESNQKDAVAELEKRKQAIENLLKPINDSLAKTQKHLQDSDQSRQRGESALKEQIRFLAEGQSRLSDATTNLTRALRRPEVRGRWGEMQLRRVAELAGMIPHCDIEEQVHVNVEDGANLRPDMVVHLPGGRDIVVDAKTPLDAYLDSLDAETDDQRTSLLDRHAQQIETQVRQLSSKQYARHLPTVPDFVILFIPGESFLQAAVQQRPDLIERAIERGVFIASPSTLITLLKAVALGWQEQKLAENAEHIKQLGQELHDRVRIVADHMSKLGNNLHQAVNRYNAMIGSFDSRMVVTTRKFEELGAGSSQSLPEQLPQLETYPQPPRSLSSESDTSANDDAEENERVDGPGN